MVNIKSCHPRVTAPETVMQTLVYQGGLLQAHVLEMPGTHIQNLILRNIELTEWEPFRLMSWDLDIYNAI